MKIRLAETLKVEEKVVRRKGINVGNQFYKGIRLNCIDREDYHCKKAKRFRLNDTNQNIWIPNKHLENDGTIKMGEKLDTMFRVCLLNYKKENGCYVAMVVLPLVHLITGIDY